MKTYLIFLLGGGQLKERTVTVEAHGDEVGTQDVIFFIWPTGRSGQRDTIARFNRTNICGYVESAPAENDEKIAA